MREETPVSNVGLILVPLNLYGPAARLKQLLKTALGGDCKTTVIATLSPADSNYDESMATIRFAERAKAIKTKAVVNESPIEN